LRSSPVKPRLIFFILIIRLLIGIRRVCRLFFVFKLL
jgi:hypothetical protein